VNLNIPTEPLFILTTLQQAGFEAYLVGGAVRDLLLNDLQKKDSAPIEATDFDFTTNATPEQILTLFPNSFYENEFGTVAMPAVHLAEMMGVTPDQIRLSETESSQSAKNQVINVESATKLHPSLQPSASTAKITSTDRNFEITTYRSEGLYSDHRRPDEVTWGKSIEEDLKRRDFTINAMALAISGKNEYRLVDLFQGMDDLKAGIIRPVGDAAARFEEDALRMLRAIRFSVQLNMKMTDETFTAISALADTIQQVSWERIRDEFLKMLASPFPAEAIELLDDTGLLKYVLPELLEGKGVEQGGHHTTDVWTHSLDALRNSPSNDPIVRLATLLHDVAKPRTFKLQDGKPTFYNHEIVGSRVAKNVAQRLRLSKAEIERIFALVRYHMFYYQPQNTDASIRRFMRKVGLENINDILDVREADRLGSGARETSWRLEEMKQRMVDQLHQPFSITDLEVNGNDLMQELNLQPGPKLGEILKALFEEVLDNPELNTKEQLLAEAKKLL
jgi:poly(A) polymerase/tRNA nucleotidyltransferase (CCA-adding enzyme)